MQSQTQPPGFRQRVAIPGAAFLKQVPRPTSHEWRKRDYWRRVLPDLRCAYGGICAYSALWISSVTGAPNVDHFEPKSTRPDLAYKWQNFRYCCAKMNTNKGQRRILDPFAIQPDWFVLDFPSLLVRPNPSLPASRTERVESTIHVLKLNDDDKFVDERLGWVREFCRGEFGFGHLQAKAPFIAYELKRQGLVGTIATIMGLGS